MLHHWKFDTTSSAGRYSSVKEGTLWPVCLRDMEGTLSQDVFGQSSPVPPRTEIEGGGFDWSVSYSSIGEGGGGFASGGGMICDPSKWLPRGLLKKKTLGR